jgi:glucose-1-phosphatase
MKQYDNLIFDLGNVLIDVDFVQTEKAFMALGLDKFDGANSVVTNDTFFHDFEVGKISPPDFVKGIQQKLPNATDAQVIDAWNALLGNWRMNSLQKLKALQNDYTLYLFSNTNAIHKIEFMQRYEQLPMDQPFESFFKKAYFSQELGRRKPDVTAFQFIMDEQKMDASRTLFIDDAIQNIEGAQAAGLQTLWLQAGMLIENEL